MKRVDAALTAVLGLYAALGLGLALAWLDAARPTPENDMATVEQMLVAHGLPVEGFARTAFVNLDAIDAMAPEACAEILRKSYLARLAVIRMMPAHADEAGKIGRAVRFTLAADAGVPECAP